MGGLDIQLLDDTRERIKVSIYGEPGWEVNRRDMVDTATPTMSEDNREMRNFLRAVFSGEGDDFIREVAREVDSWFDSDEGPKGVLIGEGWIEGSARLRERVARHPRLYVDLIRWAVDAVVDRRPRMKEDMQDWGDGNEWLEEAAHWCSNMADAYRKSLINLVFGGRSWMGNEQHSDSGSFVSVR